MRTSLSYRILFLIAILMITAQCSNPIKEELSSTDLFKKYRLEKDANIIAVPPGLVSVFLDADQPGNKEIMVILENVDKLTIMVIPNKVQVKESPCFAEIDKDFDGINFQDLAMVNSGKEIIKVKALGDSSTIDELIVLVSNYEALFCVSFIGEITMESIVNLTKPENMAAVSNLKRLSR